MKEKQALQDKWENFWYYHKYHVIAAIFVIFMIAVFINDKLAQVDYDYRISAVTDFNLTEEQISELENTFKSIADDRNQDGEVNVQISNYTITKEGNVNPQAEIANQTKFMADLETGDSMIFIYTDNVYEMYKDEMVFDVKDNTQVKLSECKKNTQPELNDMNIALRVFNGTALEKKEDMRQYYKGCKELFENFKNGK